MRRRNLESGLSDVNTDRLRHPQWSDSGWTGLREWLDDIAALLRERDLPFSAVAAELAMRSDAGRLVGR